MCNILIGINSAQTRMGETEAEKKVCKHGGEAEPVLFGNDDGTT